MDYSITIRPRLATYMKMDELQFVQPFFKLKYDGYILAKEKGKEDYENHYQIYLRTKKPTRSDAIRRSIMTLFNKNLPLDEDEKRTTVKVKQIKTNLLGVIGYPLKEKGTIQIYNISKERQEEALKHYENHKKDTEYDGKNYFRINNKNFHKKTEGFIMEHEQFYKEQGDYESDDVDSIFSEMLNKGYYLTTFLNSRNYKERRSYVLHYLNRQGEKHIEYLKNRCELYD